MESNLRYKALSHTPLKALLNHDVVLLERQQEHKRQDRRSGRCRRHQARRCFALELAHGVRAAARFAAIPGAHGRLAQNLALAGILGAARRLADSFAGRTSIRLALLVATAHMTLGRAAPRRLVLAHHLAHRRLALGLALGLAHRIITQPAALGSASLRSHGRNNQQERKHALTVHYLGKSTRVYECQIFAQTPAIFSAESRLRVIAKLRIATDDCCPE